jgi:asparagine N-glycosylation enzyme membrane subunit Stt3
MYHKRFFTAFLFLFMPQVGQAMAPCPPGTAPLPWAGTIALFVFVCLGVAQWLWLHIRIARRTNPKNRIIVHIIAFLLFCGSVALGLFSYFHFAIFNCF